MHFKVAVGNWRDSDHERVRFGIEDEMDMVRAAQFILQPY